MNTPDVILVQWYILFTLTRIVMQLIRTRDNFLDKMQTIAIHLPLYLGLKRATLMLLFLVPLVNNGVCFRIYAAHLSVFHRHFLQFHRRYSHHYHLTICNRSDSLSHLQMGFERTLNVQVNSRLLLHRTNKNSL